MQHQTIFALACSCLVHIAALLSLNTTPRGIGTPDTSNTRLPSTLIYVASPKVAPQIFRDLATQPAAPQSNIGAAASITVVTSPPSAMRPIASDALTMSKNLPMTLADINQLQSLHGLEGKSNITYWPSDEVDEAALMLAEWPEGVSASAWPPGQFVSLELWINPDGALAEIAFSQKDLPDSLRIMLVEVISSAGFKPAIKNGEPVGNHRILEVLLSQISVPPLVKY